MQVVKCGFLSTSHNDSLDVENFMLSQIAKKRPCNSQIKRDYYVPRVHMWPTLSQSALEGKGERPSVPPRTVKLNHQLSRVGAP